ncbi:unnamed protein product [Taenia asiatica]|uniref:Secreted protein n=1 Tax=Taenia asiatica TaxID=60517 RepID=A0A0R3VZH0_TAEAS|nr:unnamed protein product [Taenia asiatica]
MLLSEREGVYATFSLAYWGFVLLSLSGTFSLLSWCYAWGCAAFVGTAFDCGCAHCASAAAATDIEVSEFVDTSATNTVPRGNHCSTD